MEYVNRKNNSTKSSCDIPSPVLLRRRLSAPETVMRKYKLARGKSQESDPDQDVPKFCELSHEAHSGSDLNLQKKKESAVLMRKSTLLRRLMTNPKTLGSSSFQEWQHYCGKLSNSSLNSLQGSPEHLSKSYSRRSLVGYEFKTSPKHTSYGSTKVSPIRRTYEPHKTSVSPLNTSPKRRNDTYDCYANHHSCPPHGTKSKTSLMSSYKTNANNDIQLTSSRASIFKDHSDSAYSNDRSNITPSSISSSSTNTHLTTQEYNCYRKPNQENVKPNLDQQVVDENRNFPISTSFNYVTQESATQTASTTNLNVISNVKLSQQTLDLIVNEVMRDVQKTYINGNDVADKMGDTVHVQEIPGSQTKINGNLGSYHEEEVKRYSQNVESRDNKNDSSKLSTISYNSFGMKSEKFTDDNSDITSLADSLDESTSSRMSIRHHDDKPVRGDLPPLPKKDQKISIKNIKPADAFFVPMKANIQKEIKSVSNYLPTKLREKIIQRQQELHDKLNQSTTTFKSKFTHLSLRRSRKSSLVKSANSADAKLGDIKSKSRFKKPFLPSINPTKKINQQNEKNNSDKPTPKSRFKRKSRENIPRAGKTKDFAQSDGDFHVYTTENEYVYDGGPKRIYHRAEFRNCHKRVEILEILECVDLTRKYKHNEGKVKSKIPILVNQKPPTFRDTIHRKPAYLDFDKVYMNDSKLDQLIANILIQTLNEEVDTGVSEKSNVLDERQRGFEAISEELSQQSSNDDNENNTKNNTNETDTKTVGFSKEGEYENSPVVSTDKVPNHSEFHSHAMENMYYKGKAAVELLRSENSSSIPDGWVAFYMPQKSEESIDNASNEGKKSDNRRSEPDVKTHLAKPAEHTVDEFKNYRKHRNYEKGDMKNSTDATREEYGRVVLPPPMTRRYGQSSRRHRYEDVQNGQQPSAEWSIVLSGKNNPSFNSDLEMKIRFPSSHQTMSVPLQQQAESEENRRNSQIYEEKTRFPRIHNKYLNYNNNRDNYEGINGRLQHLPEINYKAGINNRRMSGSVASLRAMEITDMRPRQTKTSLRRYNMTRPKLHPLFESNIYDFSIDGQYQDLLRKFPHLLAVNGNSLSTERKQNVPGIGRKDIPKHNCNPH